MMRPGAIAAALLVLALLAGCASTGIAPAPHVAPATVAGPVGQEDGRELWLVPSGVPGLMMRAQLVRPPGQGPFPLALVNHGSEQDAARRRAARIPAYAALTDWLVGRGYAVLLPLRPGHGATGGPYLEDQRGCAAADYAGAGRATADSLAAAIAYMTTQDFVRLSGVVVIGNSAGGWGAIALAARNPPGVAAIVNIAGGRGGHNLGRPDSNCAPDRLVAAAAEFGRTARVPSLWLYARTDTYFSPALSQRLADAYGAAGAPVDYRLLDLPGREGHDLIETTAWRDALAGFIAR